MFYLGRKIMNNLVEVTLALDPTDAAKLVDLAGGEQNVNEYAAAIIHSLDANSSDAGEEAVGEQNATDIFSLVDLYG
jgi:hypothetical protein